MARAGAFVTRTHDGALSLGFLLGGAIVMVSLLPFGPSTAAPFFLGALVATGALLVAALAAAVVSGNLDAAWRWCGCGVLLVAGVAAVAGSAESMDLRYIVLAQANLSMHAARQPVAAALFVLAIALAGNDAALDAVAGPRRRGRTIVLALVTLSVSAFGATLFLAGYAGDRLPPLAWLGLRTLAVFLVIVFLRERLRRIAPASLPRVIWGCAIAGIVNLSLAMLRAVS